MHRRLTLLMCRAYTPLGNRHTAPQEQRDIMDASVPGTALAVLADDLTGATDTGLQFANRGYKTIVAFGEWPAETDAAAVVVNTDTRNASPDSAYERVLAVALQARVAAVPRVYKKVDSTARGNLGAEIDALLDASLATGALVCPAFPANGRTVRDGQVYVRDRLLAASEFGSDPLHPALDSRLYAIVQRQTHRAVSVLPLKLVRAGPSVVADELTRLRASGVEIVIADAVHDSDLDCLGNALNQTMFRWLPVGSAGLAARIGRGRQAKRGKGPTLTARADPTNLLWPVIVVVGSVNPVVGQQVAMLGEEFDFTPARFTLSHWLDDRVAHIAELAERLRASWEEDPVAALVVGPEQRQLLHEILGRPGTRGTLGQAGLRIELGARLSADLVEVVRRAGEGLPVGGFVVTGGDTAQALCLALRAEALSVDTQVAPGVPACRIQGGPCDGVGMVTKAGGFGDPGVLCQAVNFLWRWRE